MLICQIYENFKNSSIDFLEFSLTLPHPTSNSYMSYPPVVSLALRTNSFALWEVQYMEHVGVQVVQKDVSIFDQIAFNLFLRMAESTRKDLGWGPKLIIS